MPAYWYKWIKIAVKVMAMVICIAIYAEQVIICPKCGYENPETAKACNHCDAKLPEKEQIETIHKKSFNTDLWVGSKPGHLNPQVVEDEISIGKEWMSKAETDVAYFFFRNALALNLLTDAESGKTFGEQIVELINKCSSAGVTKKVPCDTCSGTGKGTAKFVSMKGEVSYMETPGRPCEACGGTGYLIKSISVTDKMQTLGRAKNKFTTLQKGRRFIQMGEAWIPIGLEQFLTIHQQVALRRAVAASCAKCMGIGKVECPECKGTGTIKCTNPQCRNGIVEVESGGGLGSKTKLTRKEKCPVCKGKAMINCLKCSGIGSILCPVCNSTGERAVCSTCGGQGLIQCTKCKGSGTIRNVPCEACRGIGVVICNKCNGDGRQK